MIFSRARFRRWASGLGLLAALSMHEYPKAPASPEPVLISLYVWNAAAAPDAVVVGVNGENKFSREVAAGSGVGVQEFVELLPGEHRINVSARTLNREALIKIDAAGPTWLVVIFWEKEIEIKMQQQPPWIN
ncbi:MAG: hypothetical protein HY594_00685 [Candidatus Omnitrophica bacterium]|nr:hypothetical protein [Candidatus Omnitrophota bacterium]